MSVTLITDEQWADAERHLDEVVEAYESIPTASGMPGLVLIINPIRKRFKAGERTAELYDEIMELE